MFKQLIKVCIIVGAFFWGKSVLAQSGYPLWKELKPGPYQVGFKTIDYRDKSRSIPNEGDSTRSSPFNSQFGIQHPKSGQKKKRSHLSTIF